MSHPISRSLLRAPAFALGLALVQGGCGGTTFNSGAKNDARASAAKAKKSGDALDKGVDQGKGAGDKNGTDKGDKSGTGTGTASGDKGLGSAGDTASGGTGTGATDLGGASGDLVTDAGELVKCPKNPQKILIMDYKSGWWAGDGGQFFTKIIGGLHDECVGAVSIEYHHLVTSGASLFMGGGGDIMNTTLSVPGGKAGMGGSDFGSAFADATFNSYTQIWVLSGANNDPMDIHPGNAFLDQVLSATANSKANVFIGGGYGSIMTGNAFAGSLGLGTIFSTQQEEGRLLAPMAGVGVTSVLKVGAQLKKHVLFTRGIADIADNLVVGGQPAAGDTLSNSGGLEVIATDTQGQPSIAAGTKGTRKIVLDAGMHRYYATWNDGSAGTLQLLKNIITFLSK